MTARSIPLGGCDVYLLALDDLMRDSGQGRHVGVTVLRIAADFDAEGFQNAVARFAATQSLLGASLSRGLPGRVPKWVSGARARIEIRSHPENSEWQPVARSRLQGRWNGLLCFDVIPATGGGATVLMGWSHLVLDARGIELALAEIALLASKPDAAPESDSWALPPAGARGLRQRFHAVRPFLDRYWSLRENRVVSLAPPPSGSSEMEFEVLHFSSAETARIKARAMPATAGIFTLPWFLAATMRAHAGVLSGRGRAQGALECTISVQTRKRGARGPIFQNQVSQLFFALRMEELDSMDSAFRKLHEQFSGMTRNKCDTAFLVMIDWMRRLPKFLYRRFLLREASGQIASFYHAHTGEFLPGVRDFCGGRILDGWHVPSVPQPPGTGLFFSERAGCLSASLCWRRGAISDVEKEVMVRRLRADLLGSET